MKQQSVHDAEHGGIRPDAQSQDNDDTRSDQGAAKENPESKANVPKQSSG
jgi:hypothetical protein